MPENTEATFLAKYDQKKYDCPSVTSDAVAVILGESDEKSASVL